MKTPVTTITTNLDVLDNTNDDHERVLGIFYNMCNAGCDPLRYRTALCENVSKSKCQYKNCFFHHIDEKFSKRTVSENAKKATQLVMYLLDQRQQLLSKIGPNNGESVRSSDATGEEEELSALHVETARLAQQLGESEAQLAKANQENQLMRQLLMASTSQQLHTPQQLQPANQEQLQQRQPAHQQRQLAHPHQQIAHHQQQLEFTNQQQQLEFTNQQPHRELASQQQLHSAHHNQLHSANHHQIHSATHHPPQFQEHPDFQHRFYSLTQTQGAHEASQTPHEVPRDRPSLAVSSASSPSSTTTQHEEERRWSFSGDAQHRPGHTAYNQTHGFHHPFPIDESLASLSLEVEAEKETFLTPTAGEQGLQFQLDTSAAQTCEKLVGTPDSGSQQLPGSCCSFDTFDSSSAASDAKLRSRTESSASILSHLFQQQQQHQQSRAQDHNPTERWADYVSTSSGDENDAFSFPQDVRAREPIQASGGMLYNNLQLPKCAVSAFPKVIGKVKDCGPAQFLGAQMSAW